jgi:hypothetical protein
MSEPTAAAAAVAPTDTPPSPELATSAATQLGPAVTPDFPPVVGLQELIKQPGVAKVKAPAAPPPPPPPTVKVESKLFLSTLQLLDRVASNMLKVDPEPDEILSGVADAITPLAEYYAAKGEAGVALAWGNLAVALAGVAFVKYKKVQDRRELEQRRSGTAQPEQQESTNGKPEA